MASDSAGTISLDLVLQSSEFQSQINAAAKQAVQQFDKASTSITSGLKKIATVAAAAFSVKEIVSFSKECLELGSDLAEVQNVVDVTFGTLSSEVEAFAESAASSFGLSETMAKQYMGTFGSMAEAFGFSESAALEMSEALTGLTGDVASFYNLDQDAAYTKLKSVFTGETESLKELGVVMTQSALDSYALANGFGKTTAEMTEAEKVSLRLAFVQDQLANAQGDYARTSDGWANSTRTLSLQFDSLKAELGQGLINVLSPIVSWLNTIIEKLVEAASKFKDFTAAIMGIEDSSTSSSATTEATETLNSAISETTEEAEEAAEALKDLMGFDEINRLSEIDTSDETGSDTSDSDDLNTVGAATESDATPSIDTSGILTALANVKAVWADLYDRFKTGLIARLDAGGFLTALDTIKQNLGSIWDSLKSIFTNGDVAASAKYMLEQIATYFGHSVGNFLSIGANLGAALTQGISDFLEEKKDFLSEKLSSIFDSAGDIFGSLTGIQDDITDIINYVLGLDETAEIISDAINIVVTPIATAVDNLFKSLRDNLAGLEQVISNNKDGFMEIGEDIAWFFSSVSGTISNFVDDISANATAVYDEYLKPAIDNIWDGIDNLVSFLMGIWEQYIQPFLDDLGNDISFLVSDHISPMVQKVQTFLGKLMEALSELWENVLEPLVEYVVRNVMPKIKLAVNLIWKTVKYVIGVISDKISVLMDFLGGLIDFIKGVFTGDWDKAWEGIQEMFGAVVDDFENTFDNFREWIGDILDSIVDYFSEEWENVKQNLEFVWGGIKTFFENWWSYITGMITAAWEGIKKVFSNIGKWFKDKFTEAKNAIVKAWETVVDYFKGIWDDIKAAFSNVKDWFSEKFQAAWDSIKDIFSNVGDWFGEKFSDAWDSIKESFTGVKDFFSGVWDKITSVFGNVKEWFKEKFHSVKDAICDVFSDIGDWMKTPINSIIDAINWVIEKLNDIHIDFPDWMAEAIGIDGLGFDIPTIPHLATGGYVKANTPQLAVIGDNKREGEIVAPESKIAEAVAAGFEAILAKLQGSDSSTQQNSDTALQANIYLGNELLSQQLVRMSQVRNLRSGGLA